MRALVLTVLVLSLSACAGERPLFDFSGSDGPDEFSVTPGKPLELPETLALPQPTPGGANRADVNPEADAIAALGGRPSALSAGGVPASDSGLVNYAGRNGVTSNIRTLLAEEDASLRQTSRRFGLFGAFRGERYFGIYAGQALDAYSELERFRSAGVQTPTAPPQN